MRGADFRVGEDGEEDMGEVKQWEREKGEKIGGICATLKDGKTEKVDRRRVYPRQSSYICLFNVRNDKQQLCHCMIQATTRLCAKRWTKASANMFQG